MFRQVRKHAASTSSKGNREEKQFLLYAPTCTRLKDLCAWKGVPAVGQSGYPFVDTSFFLDGDPEEHEITATLNGVTPLAIDLYGRLLTHGMVDDIKRGMKEVPCLAEIYEEDYEYFKHYIGKYFVETSINFDNAEIESGTLQINVDGEPYVEIPCTVFEDIQSYESAMTCCIE